MTDDETALLAAIVDAPEDDAPRLVYADVLAARGDPRGELIVAQCRLARGEGDVEALDKRVRALLEAGWKAYAGELAPYASASAFERGFVHEARMTVAAFAKHGDRVFGSWPTHTLEIANPKLTARDLEKLAATPALARVRGLRLGHHMRSEGRVELAPLAKSPHLGRLQHLELASCGHSAADWTKFFAKLHAPALASIKLHYSYTSAAVQAAIAGNPSLGALRRLDEYVYTSLDKKGAAARTREAYAQLAQRELHELSIEQHEIVDDDTLAPLFARGAKAALRRLHLSMTGVTNKLLRAIASSPKAAALEDLAIHDGGAVTLDGVRALLESPRATKLRRLALTSYGWTDEASAAYEQSLLALPASHPLREVELPGNAEGSPALRARFPVR